MHSLLVFSLSLSLSSSPSNEEPRSTWRDSPSPLDTRPFMASTSPSVYDPYNQISYVELNKLRYGEIERDESERLENRSRRPSVRKIYLKKNGDSRKNKAKLFVWKKWASPTLKLLIEEAGAAMGMGDSARFLYDSSGHRVRDEHEVMDKETYYIVGDEQLETFDSPSPPRRRTAPSRQSYVYNKPPKSAPRRLSNARQPSNSRRASWWSINSEDLIDFDYDKYDYGPPSPSPRRRSKSSHSLYDHQHYDSVPRPFSSDRSYYRAPSADLRPSSTYRHYDYGESTRRTHILSAPKQKSVSAPVKKKIKERRRSPERREVSSRHTYAGRETSRGRPRTRAASALGLDDFVSDFDDHDTKRKDKEALRKHAASMASYRRSKSAVIYNRRDQTHPDAYIVYVFLNGQGMNCQYVNFQRKQLEKGLNYVLEIIARRFNVNPSKLCDMDGKKIGQVQDLMSRGAYVLVPMGQAFRDQWYFLPDNAIDTSSNVDKVRERSAQRDRLLQRKEKKLKNNATSRTVYDFSRTKSTDRSRRKKSIY